MYEILGPIDRDAHDINREGVLVGSGAPGWVVFDGSMLSSLSREELGVPEADLEAGLAHKEFLGFDEAPAQEL